MAKILVTGGAGFIGSHLCDRLVSEGHAVIVLDDFSSGRAENLESVGEGVEVINDSLLNIGQYVDRLQGVGRVYHLAALISGYESLRDPEGYIEVNLTGLSRLIATVQKLGGPRIVFASSSTVYGNPPGGAPVRAEVQLPAPLTMYALSKLAGEQMLHMYREFAGLDHVSLRLFNVYGPRQNPDHPYANVTCKFAHAAANGLPVKRYGDGEQSRDFVYIDDVVDALCIVGERSRHRVYNVGTGREFSINTLLRAVGGIAGRPLKVEQCEAWDNDIRSIRADVARLEEEFGFVPRVDLSTGLERTVEYFRNAPVAL